MMPVCCHAPGVRSEGICWRAPPKSHVTGHATLSSRSRGWRADERAGGVHRQLRANFDSGGAATKRPWRATRG